MSNSDRRTDNEPRAEQQVNSQAGSQTGNQTDQSEQTSRAAMAARFLRLQQHFGKDELSRMAGVSEPQVYRYTTGENEPRASVLAALLQNSAVAAEWLLNGKGPMFRLEREFLLQLDQQLLAQTLMTLDELIPQPYHEGDHRMRAEVAVATYLHSLRPPAQPKR